MPIFAKNARFYSRVNWFSLVDSNRGLIVSDLPDMILQDKVAVIDKQIRELIIFKQELEELISGWEAVTENSEDTICPIIEKV
jgi:hypothetical protein